MTYKFLIYISYSYALPIGDPLEKEILKRGYTVKWFSDIDDGKNAIKHKKNKICTVDELLDYKPDIVLAATNNVPDFITGLKVQIFHGFFTRKRPQQNNDFSHFRIRGFFDLYCTHGPNTTSVFLNKKKQKGYFEVIETGWSKVDPLFPLVKDENSIKNSVLIATTFTKRVSLAYDDEVFEEIKRLSQDGTFEFKMVMHPKIPNELKNKWASLSGKHFQFIDTTDLMPLYKQSDILFADTTSVVQEFLLQLKPVVCYRHTFNHNYLLHVAEAKAIERSLKQALTYPEKLINNIKAFVKDLHPYQDGKSSERIIDGTIEFLHKDKNYIKDKPLNLIRKYKIRKQLHHFTLKTYTRPYTVNAK